MKTVSCLSERDNRAGPVVGAGDMVWLKNRFDGGRIVQQYTNSEPSPDLLRSATIWLTPRLELS